MFDRLKPFPANQMQLTPVSTLVNSPRNESPRCIERVAVNGMVAVHSPDSWRRVGGP
jgi:hypothetical protein